MYPGCSFYGIKEILLSYAGLPKYFPFPVAVQHGWQYVATSFEASTKPPEIWVWSERIAKDYERFYPKTKIRVVGSFFSYFMKSINTIKSEKYRRGSVCITPHSTHFSNTKYSIDEYILSLCSLDDQYKPITVMLYYLDMNPTVVDAYKKAGFTVVTNGSLFKSDFINKFILNVSDKQYCIFSDIGSAVFFCADLGLHLVRLNIQSEFLNMGNVHMPDHVDPVNAVDLNQNLFRSWDKENYSLELGKPCLLSPSEMRNLILSNYFSREFLYASARRLAHMALQSCGLEEETVKLP